MKRMLGLIGMLTVAAAGGAQGQGGGGSGGGTGRDMGTGRGRQVADHWISPDSLIAMLGITDPAIAGKITLHLAEVDSAMKEAAEERKRNVERRGLPGAAQAMGVQLDRLQGRIRVHLNEVRKALPKENRAAFDRLEKPDVRPAKLRGRL